jgi:hypothetical protein
VQEKACRLFTEVESQGEKLEQLVNTTEQCLEGSVNEALIQKFVEQEAVAIRQVEEKLVRPE